MAREIELSQGYRALVDDDDYEYLAQWKWHASRRRSVVYAARSCNKRDDGEKRGLMLLHRQLLGTEHGMEVDHIDGDGLNNQRSNLRICTHRQNSWNRRKRIKNGKSSRFKGVTWYSNVQSWKATIIVDGDHYHLGFFDTEEDAAKRYDKEALARFGEFACLNFPATLHMECKS